MPQPKPKPIQLPFNEVYPLLCPKCQMAIKLLLGDKVAKRAVKE
jgi:hypothetical protein